MIECIGYLFLFIGIFAIITGSRAFLEFLSNHYMDMGERDILKKRFSKEDQDFIRENEYKTILDSDEDRDRYGKIKDKCHDYVVLARRKASKLDKAHDIMENIIFSVIRWVACVVAGFILIGIPITHFTVKGDINRYKIYLSYPEEILDYDVLNSIEIYKSAVGVIKGYEQSNPRQRWITEEDYKVAITTRDKALNDVISHSNKYGPASLDIQYFDKEMSELREMIRKRK